MYRLALLGDPVEHSRSPAIHRVLLRLSGLQGDYRAIRADPAVLSEAISALRDGTWQGLNVTMPLKRDAAELADHLAPDAELSRSVNTLAPSRGEVTGHSTDTTTFMDLFADPRFRGMPVLLLGAGGSAAAALAGLGRGADVYVSARRLGAAVDLVSGLGKGETLAWGKPVVGALVVNTTPLGMSGEPLPAPVLGAARALIDLPYGTRPTPAVATAAETGIPFADGHEFLVRQAIASFTIWTGVEPALETVLGELRND